MTNKDLAVYLGCCDEDLTIEPVWRAISKVFPQVKVLDVGSRDTSSQVLARIGADVIHVPVMTDESVQRLYAPTPRQAFIAVKNHYVGQHKWVLWVDGDELWPEEELYKIVPAINSNQYIAYRIGWKFATEHSGDKHIYDNHVQGGDRKIFDASICKWRRTYPKEYLFTTDDGGHLGIRSQDPGEYVAWCWHLRFMLRTTARPKNRRRGIRRNKTLNWLDKFDKIKVDKFPWE